MSNRALQKIFSQNIATLISYIYKNDCSCTLGEAFIPTKLAQARKEDRPIKTHFDRMALDLNIYKKDSEELVTCREYEKFGRYWETLNTLNRAGCFFKVVNINHFDMCVKNFNTRLRL